MNTRYRGPLLDRESYEALLKHSSDLIAIIDAQGTIRYASPAYRRILGYGPDDVIGGSAFARIHPDDMPLVRHAFQEVIARDGEPITVRYRCRTADDTWKIIEATGASHIADPLVRGIVLNGRDVTENVQAYELLEERVQQRTRELSMLLDVSQKAASILELRPLLGLMVDAMGDVVDYGSAGLLLREGNYLVEYDHQGPGSMEELVAAGIMAEARLPVDIYQPGWDVYLGGGTVIIDDLAGDTEIAVAFRELAGESVELMLQMMRSFMGIPLIHKGEIVGLLNLTSPEPHHFTERHANLGLAIASQAAVAVVHARLHEQTRRWAAIEERQRLARELHDSVSQALYGIALGSKTARTLLEHDPGRVAEPLDYVVTQAEVALAEMRALIFELRPEALESEGLVPALEKQADSVRVRHKLKVETDLCDEPNVPFPVKESLYRIAQEALHNTVKHAVAGEARVSLCQDDGWLVLEVTDNGRGFDQGEEFPGHLGLQTMRERAIMLGGRVDVSSTLEGGTRVRARVPMGADFGIFPPVRGERGGL